LRILLVEDEKRLADVLGVSLREAGFAVDLAHEGEDAQALGDSVPYDAVVLDLGLPKRDGIEVLSAWRKAGRNMPVLILTARDAWADKVQGFRAGADDYLTKPFRTEEVIVRLRALIRRAAGFADSVIACGDLALDTQLGAFTLSGMPLKLTAFEWRILVYLIHRAESVVSRSELVEHAYEDHVDRDYNSIEVIVGRLRKKIGRDRILTIRGMGYRLTASQ
jgi:two-component system OmpR family response regulator